TREHLRASPARARTRRYQVPSHGGKDLGPPRPPAESRTTTTLRPSAGYRLISSVPLSDQSPYPHDAPTISRIPFNFLRPLIRRRNGVPLSPYPTWVFLRVFLDDEWRNGDPGFNLIELCQCLYSLIRPITFPLTLTSRPALTKIFAISRSFIFILNSESVREPVFTETTERLQRLVVQTRNATGRTPRSPVPTITIAQPRHFPSEGRASVSNNR